MYNNEFNPRAILSKNSGRYSSSLLRSLICFISTCVSAPRGRGAKWRSRRQLEELDKHQLADIGLTKDDVKREAAKPYWHD